VALHECWTTIRSQSPRQRHRLVTFVNTYAGRLGVLRSHGDRYPIAIFIITVSGVVSQLLSTILVRVVAPRLFFATAAFCCLNIVMEGTYSPQYSWELNERH
jgi:hypothetical protein